jgi:hypothetical protein
MDEEYNGRRARETPLVLVDIVRSLMADNERLMKS